MKKLLKVILICGTFLAATSLVIQAQVKEKEEAERQIAPTLLPILPHFVALQGPKTIYCKPQLEIKTRNLCVRNYPQLP